MVATLTTSWIVCLTMKTISDELDYVFILERIFVIEYMSKRCENQMFGYCIIWKLILVRSDEAVNSSKKKVLGCTQSQYCLCPSKKLSWHTWMARLVTCLFQIRVRVPVT